MFMVSLPVGAVAIAFSLIQKSLYFRIVWREQTSHQYVDLSKEKTAMLKAARR
jgi:hypothetical protein